MVLKQVGRLTIIGGVIGITAALYLGRFVKSLLYDLEGHDPVVVVTAALLLALRSPRHGRESSGQSVAPIHQTVICVHSALSRPAVGNVGGTQ